MSNAAIINKQPLSKIDQLLSIIPLERFRNPAPNIAVIKLSGVISAKSSAFSKGLNIETLNPVIEQAFKTPRLQAVCLIINSPGGSPVQSELIAARIRALAVENDVKIYAFVEDVAASGGYWLACCADYIYASKSSIIGSIGVVSRGFGFHEAMKKLGVERRVYSEGKNKSMLDPFEPAKQSDIKIIKKIQQDIHEHFIDYVKSRRKNRITQSDDIIYNGEFWAGEVALDFGLIDGLDNIYDFAKKNFGDNVNLKEIGAKESWFKRKFGFLSTEQAVSSTLNKLEERSYYNDFGL